MRDETTTSFTSHGFDSVGAGVAMSMLFAVTRERWRYRECVLHRWLKRPGDDLQPGEPLCVWSTEDGDVTISFDGPESGWVLWHEVAEGEEVDVRGSLLDWSDTGPLPPWAKRPVLKRRPRARALRAPLAMLSYRRLDSEAYVGRLHENLSAHLGDDAVFMDVFSIPPGADWELTIQQAAAGCRAMVAVMGPQWATASDSHGPRIMAPWDRLRLELTAALDRGTRVFPVLVGGASLPRREDLPNELWDLLRYQAVELSVRGWRAEVSELLAAIRSQVGVGGPLSGTSEDT